MRCYGLTIDGYRTTGNLQLAHSAASRVVFKPIFLCSRFHHQTGFCPFDVHALSYSDSQFAVLTCLAPFACPSRCVGVQAAQFAYLNVCFVVWFAQAWSRTPICSTTTPTSPPTYERVAFFFDCWIPS